ncbi:hypothetical protein [Streptomyces candidus]|uniref:Uncharacterized protein n=1 Tax=Streptomyces candidus TaxID=67283 RepID=A0A7X0HNW3_9ACTN|nr:hypothetical protein [Streptomyces candidus]MBB6439879.1 hypothetical protein [Streptomyces candidus]GHH55811.1 hypothetical protein GCM10018773_60740 [Streptomyces candidus]
MTTLEDLLATALLAPSRPVPRDIVPLRDPAPAHKATPPITPPPAPNTSAADDLRALCETLVTHTPATAVSAFVTDQIPEPRSALILACVLQLTDTDDAARFWWQYAAGAGQPAAAYCLYLHHLSLGEHETARWWHRQTNNVQPTPTTSQTTIRCNNQPTVLHHDASLTSILRLLRGLARQATRTRSAVLTELMDYMPTAVAIGYLREPDIELPLPGPGFARRIRTLLDNAASRPDSPSDLPARPHPQPKTRPDNTPCPPRTRRQVGETATR